MQQIKPHMMEYAAESIFMYTTYSRGGCRHAPYTPICASGPNGSTLHYGHAASPNGDPCHTPPVCAPVSCLVWLLLRCPTHICYPVFLACAPLALFAVGTLPCPALFACAARLCLSLFSCCMPLPPCPTLSALADPLCAPAPYAPKLEQATLVCLMVLRLLHCAIPRLTLMCSAVPVYLHVNRL